MSLNCFHFFPHYEQRVGILIYLLRTTAPQTACTRLSRSVDFPSAGQLPKVRVLAQRARILGEDVEKREPSCTAGGNVNWCSLYGKQDGGAAEINN